jgi:hypothetical protein
MYSWYSWLVDIDPLRWYFNALFQNELKGNDNALGRADFGELEELYGWTSSIPYCCSLLICMIVVLKVASFFALRFIDHSSA